MTVGVPEGDGGAFDAGSTPADCPSDATTDAGAASSDCAAAQDAMAHRPLGVIQTLTFDVDGGAVSGSDPHVSGDGRYVSFVYGSALPNAFIRDTCVGTSAPPGCTPATIPRVGRLWRLVDERRGCRTGRDGCAATVGFLKRLREAVHERLGGLVEIPLQMAADGGARREQDAGEG